MISSNGQISSSQMSRMLILNIIGAGILGLPRILAQEVGTDGWIVLVMGGLGACLAASLHAFIICSLPHKNLKEIVVLSTFKPMAYIYLPIFTIYLTILNGLLLRVFVDVMKMFMLLKTPTEVIIVSLLLVTVFLSRKGVETMGRMAEIMLPVIFVSSIILFCLALQESKASNLLPLLQTPAVKILQTAPMVFFSFLGFDLILIFGKSLSTTKGLIKKAGGAVGSVTAFYIFLNACALMVFGSEQTRLLIWPTLSLFKTVDFPGLFIENIEAFVMAVWVLTIFMSIAPTFLATVSLLGQMTNSQEYNYLNLPLLPFIFFVALWADNMAETYLMLYHYVTYISIVVVVLFPAIIALGIVLKKLHKKEATGQDEV